MAFVAPRPGRRGVYVYFIDPNTGKQVQLPRTQTKHLDGKPPEAIAAWVESWERDHGLARDRTERMHLKEGDKLAALWKQYQAHRQATRKRRDRSATDELAVFEQHIVPFFVGAHQKKNPVVWHDIVPAFHTHLFEQKLADRTVQKVLWTLERFGRHLVFARLMTFPYAVQVPSRQNNKITPLQVRKTPDEILKFVRKAKYEYSKIDFNLMVLLGYFAALRPSELFALSKEDLLTGAAAEDACRTLEGFREHDLGTRLAVNVTKTLPPRKNEPVEMTKNETSRAVVNIWNPDAAKLIAAAMKERPDGRLFPFSAPWLERAYRENVKPLLGVTPHDLRRSSCLYLGRTLRLPVTLLQEHMRHAEIETTMLYMREPATPDKRRPSKQNFDDVL